jgi:hypothetical protein
MELQIEASAEDLTLLRRMLDEELGDQADVQPLSSTAPGELREPLLIGLVVALGGPVIVKSVTTVISRWMEHREKMKDKELAQLKLLVDGRSKQISVNELKAMAKAIK